MPACALASFTLFPTSAAPETHHDRDRAKCEELTDLGANYPPCPISEAGRSPSLKAANQEG